MDEAASTLRLVRAVGDQFFTMAGAVMPLFANDSLYAPTRPWRRAMIVLHGRQRNAEDYFAIACAAARQAGVPTLVIAPQLLAGQDVKAHGLGPEFLYWDETGWMGGDEALGPARLSGFTLLDLVLAHLQTPALFPHLQHIVLAGHSGGGQVMHRYAILTGASGALSFVIANPSSYAYFSPERPAGDSFAPPDAARFPGYDDWKYGMNRRPAYGAALDAATLEARYAARDVTYLLGTRDCDTAHPALDRSLAAQAQGPHRLARGQAYWRYLRQRNGARLRHHYFEIAEVGHEPLGMLTAKEARACLFGLDTAPAEGIVP